jgi:uncharacterized protein YggE
MSPTPLFALAVLGWAATAAGQTPPPQPPPPTVVARGEAVVTRAPDRAFVTIAAESRAKTPDEAQQANARAMTAVLDKLKGAGVPADAVRTMGYELQPEFDYANGKQTLRGYLARNSVEVTVDALDKLGDYLNAAVGAGATQVSGIRFDLKDRAGAEREALRKAVEDARARAEAAAAGAGLTIDRIVRIEESGAIQAPPPRPMMMAARAEMAQAPVPPPVVAGDLEIRASVTLTAAVK